MLPTSTIWASVLVLWFPIASGLVRLRDKEALIALYENTDGANWGLTETAPDDPSLANGGNYNWDFETDPCTFEPSEAWYGVACYDPCYEPIDGPDCRLGRITGLQLPFNNMTGALPSTLFQQLNNLTIVDLSFNKISGTIPTEVGWLRNMMIFSLRQNQLSGTIPTEIRTIGSHIAPPEDALSLSDLPQSAIDALPNYTYTPSKEITQTMGLNQFDLSANFLNGTIPTTIGELINLQAVDFSENPYLGADGCCSNETVDSYYSSFYGYNYMLPTEIGQLTKLQVMKLDYSRFMRWIPTEVGNLRSLEFWRVMGSYHTNQVSGTIPTEMGRMSSLTEFMMANNSLSGTLPTELGNLTNLERVSLQDNDISGTIPDFFGSFPSLYEWDTFGNKLEGPLPTSIGLVGNLESLYIDNEHLAWIRNYYCKQRVEQSANGRKYNYAMLSREVVNFGAEGLCANPFDKAGAFDTLYIDV